MIKSFSFTDKGPRPENQDSFCLLILENRILTSVADGVGGSRGGKTASQIAVNTALSCFINNESVEKYLDFAHTEILRAAAESDELQGMATTLTVTTYESGVLCGAHCGDSRAYLLRGQGIKQLTFDHTEVAKLIADGKLSKDDAKNYPRRNVLTSALGSSKDLEIQTFHSDIMDGDRLLLITDGIYSKVSKYEIQQLSLSEFDFSAFCKKIITTVSEKGANDNFTIVGIEFN